MNTERTITTKWKKSVVTELEWRVTKEMYPEKTGEIIVSYHVDGEQVDSFIITREAAYQLMVALDDYLAST